MANNWLGIIAPAVVDVVFSHSRDFHDHRRMRHRIERYASQEAMRRSISFDKPFVANPAKNGLESRFSSDFALSNRLIENESLETKRQLPSGNKLAIEVIAQGGLDSQEISIPWLEGKSLRFEFN